MTIYGNAELMWSRETSDANLTDNYKKTTFGFLQCYQVFTSPDTEILEVYTAPGLPAAGSTFPGLPPYVFAKMAKPRRISPMYWLVDVEYEGEISLTSGGGIGSPFDARPRVKRMSREVMVDVDEDYDGNRITNTIGEPLTARIMLFERVYTVTRNMLFFNDYAFSDYDLAVNSDYFLGWPPGTGRVKIEAENVYADTGYGGYWTVTGTFYFKKPYRTTPDKAWYSRHRNDGYYVRDPDFVGPIPPPPATQPKLVPAVDKNKVPVTKPVQLDANGNQLTDGTAYWLEKRHFETLPFSALGLL